MIRCLRPVDSGLTAAFPAAGLFASWTATGQAGAPRAWALVCAGAFAVASAAFGFNSLTGRRDDRHNPRLSGSPLVGDRVPTAAVAAGVAVAAVAGLGLFAAVGARSLAWAAVVLGAGALYSLPLRSAKRAPGAAALLHALGAAAFVQAGAGTAGSSAAGLFASGLAALVFVTGHVHHVLLDREADLRARTPSLAQRTSPRRLLAVGSAGFAAVHLALAGGLVLGVWSAPLAVPFLALAPLQALAVGAAFRGGATPERLLRYRRVYRALYVGAAIVAAGWWSLDRLAASWPGVSSLLAGRW